MKTVYEIYYHKTEQRGFYSGRLSPMFKTWDKMSPQVSAVSFYPKWITNGEPVNLITITVDKPFFINDYWIEEIITPAEIKELAKVNG